MQNTKSAVMDERNAARVCNTCVRPYDDPFRYWITGSEARGCVDRCHDEFIRRNVHPNWMKPRYVLPKWITECRSAIRRMSQANGSNAVKSLT